MLGELAVLGRRLAEDAGAEPEEEIEALLDVEAALVEDDLGTA